ncbi:hypothetical protein FA09DRAFT_326505 [Tilletiopsis washingtonensis]|uniref:DH domain-containing protein n=1 Tax=Tilletiopsis washingtonensis TaxID=58919 RepID=A0A316Z4L2_9BASI|nr:hypothetical protein FA09DRAFT_326505 [Tilletiopsis washingtonensis]PWN95898.1 hypothetical protein FA09DRAFT_326505 [Tilletiopsis washingtonensis]
MGTVVLSDAPTTFTPVAPALSLLGELPVQASGGPCAASCSRTAASLSELASAVLTMQSAEHYDETAPLASPTGESSQSGASTPSASRMLQASRDPMDQAAAGAPQQVLMSRGISAESSSSPFVTPPGGEAVDLGILTPPVRPATPPAPRRHSTASSVASSGRRSLCDGVAALASHILSVRTSPEQLARAATPPILARRRSREADVASSSSGRSQSSAIERSERRGGNRSLSFSESEEVSSALGLANMTAGSDDMQQTRRRANSEAPQPSVAVSGSASSSTPGDRSDAPEIGRTLSTSTSTTDRSSNVSSLDTCATSTGSLSDAMPPGKELHIDTVNVPAPSVPQAPHSPDGQGERPHTTPQTTPELLFPPAGSRRTSDGQRFSKLRRLYALHELVETERRFAEDLSLLMVFFDNLSDQPYFSEHPERVATVTRNARQMLLLHTKVADKLEAILRDAGVDPADGVGADAASSEAAESAVVAVAQYFTQMGPSLAAEFAFFCSRHAEALAVVREAERRHGGDDWKAFERSCGNILRGLSRGIPRSTHSHSRSHSGSATPVSGSHFLTGLAPLTQLSGGFDSASLAPLTPYGTSAPTTPMSESASSSMLREGAARLLFSDYFVKPIQRLCLYPVCLNTLLKHSPEDEDAHAPLLAALSTMRKVAEDVDRAGREREKDLMAELISSRIEPQMSVTPAFIGSLGHCLLAGALDVCHHHSIVNPLSAPLRFKYQAVFLYRGFLTIAKVRKPHTYEPKHWFPLWAARLDDASLTRGERSATASSSVLPLSFRIICQGGHYFELVASSAREREIWIDHLSRAIVDAPLTANVSTGFPSSLGSASRLAIDLGDPGAPTPDEYDVLDPLSAFFAENAASPTPVDITVRYAPASQRATVDRATVFSDVIYQVRSGSAFGQRTDVDGSLPSWHSATPAIGAAVGAAMGFARAAARKTVSRRSSAILLSDEELTADGPLGAAGAALAAAELRLNGSSADGATWKQKMRTSRSRPALFVSPSLRGSADQLVSQSASPSSIFGNATLHDEPVQALTPVTPSSHVSESNGQRAATLRPTHARTKASVLNRRIWPSCRRSPRSPTLGPS